MSPRHGRRASHGQSYRRWRAAPPTHRIALAAGALTVVAGVGTGVAVVQSGGGVPVTQARTTTGDSAAFSAAFSGPSPRRTRATSSPSLRRTAKTDPRAGERRAGRSRPTPAAPGRSRAGKRAPATAASTAKRIVELVNQERQVVGCRPVTLNPKLTDAAQTSTDAMARTGVLSHTGPDGSSLADRMAQAGYSWSAVGENIAQGQRTAEEVMDDWMKSVGHRANILNCFFNELGVGVHEGDGGPWWAQDFGTGR